MEDKNHYKTNGTYREVYTETWYLRDNCVLFFNLVDQFAKNAVLAFLPHKGLEKCVSTARDINWHVFVNHILHRFCPLFI